jgi:hypothetical protein
MKALGGHWSYIQPLYELSISYLVDNFPCRKRRRRKRRRCGISNPVASTERRSVIVNHGANVGKRSNTLQTYTKNKFKIIAK